LSLHLPTEGTYIDITVADTGCGIDEATLSRIFEPFFTTKPPGRGSGLGLAMVYSSIRGHHGAVYAESTLGRGTKVRVLLPATR
jgi:signal transduction histidine kinase